MISITLAANDIPDGCSVRKTTGYTQYALRRGITIYGDKKQVITPDKGVVFLVSENGNINCVSANKKLSIDFDNKQDAIEFLCSYK